ncbi:reverse transcriptase domain-containing protein [Leuconostoc pseudomesenteroides]|uniref:reverse transcriptase domain-containing protein n=1 Tax=Leuconostoc pseudomesenteroides TaxID=33968 RepID=UPI00345E9884
MNIKKNSLKISDFSHRDSFISTLEKNNKHFRKFDVQSTIQNASALYSEKKIPKKTSGFRVISIPSQELKIIQVFVKELIENQLEYFDYKFSVVNHAFQKEKSIYTNAQVHGNKKYILHVDLKDFFSSIHFGRISGYLSKNKNFKLPSYMAYFFADICCLNGILPQGSPASPVISNLIAENLDKKVLSLSKEYHFIYTRYVDDLVFSTNDTAIIMNYMKAFLYKLNVIVENQGFHINWEKLNLMGPDVRHTVTGLSNNKRVSVTKDFYLTTRSIANNFYCTNSFYSKGILYPGYERSDRQKNLNFVEGLFSFIYDIEVRNKNFHKKKTYGESLQGVNHNNYQPSHKVSMGTNNSLSDQIFNGKIFLYSKFLFFKYFLFGDLITVFTEGITDPLYLYAAMKSLDYQNDVELISIQEMQKKEMVFPKLFNLSRGGSALRRLIDYYNDTVKNGKTYYDFFKNKMVPLKPVVLLFDYEISTRKPLGQAINLLAKYGHNPQTVKEELSENGFYFVGDNLYIATTVNFNDKTDDDRAIEDYFPIQFLGDVNGDHTRHFADENSKFVRENEIAINELSTPMYKEELAQTVLKKTSDNVIFKDFSMILSIFSKIRLVYMNKVIDCINEDRINTIYNILDSRSASEIIEKNTELEKKFDDKLSDLLKIHA